MAATDVASSGSTPVNVPRREQFSDFALVLKNGHELKCHKFMLAKISPVFHAMLGQDFVETQTSKMQVTEFEQTTVESFLDYIYADLELVEVQDAYYNAMSFDKKRLTPELMKMCHMYQVKPLQEMCEEHLKNNLEDSNVVDIWTVAEKVHNEELKTLALEYFSKRFKSLLEIPGMEKSFESPQLMKSLVTYMADRLVPPQPPPPPVRVITVNVKCYFYGGWNDRRRSFVVPITAKTSDTVRTLRFLITESQIENDWMKRCETDSCKIRGSNHCLDESRTLGSYQLADGSWLECEMEELCDCS